MNEQANIEVSSYPLPFQTDIYDTILNVTFAIKNVLAINICFLLSIFWSSFIYYLVEMKRLKFNRLQFYSGLKNHYYWSALVLYNILRLLAMTTLIIIVKIGCIFILGGRLYLDVISK